MSKSILTLMIVALVSANSAFASRGRLTVMGTADPLGLNDRGSFYVDDNQNIFYNPAQVNNFKNWAAVEKDNGNTSAEGGFVTSMSGFNVGVYMNRGELSNAAVGGNVRNTRPVDIFFGGDMGVKWGVGLTYAGDRQGDDNNRNDLTLRVGADVNGLEPFAAFKILGTTTTAAGDADDQKTSDMSVGVRYKFGEWTPFVAWRQRGFKQGSNDSNTTDSAIGLGIGRSSRVAEGIRLNYAASLHRAMKGTAVGTNSNILPLDISVEADATSWLVLRAGLSYRLVDRRLNVTDATDTTTGRFGASINMGKASLDWAIANAGGVDGQNFDFSNGLFSIASLNYRW